MYFNTQNDVFVCFFFVLNCNGMHLNNYFLNQFVIISIHLIEICYYVMFICCFMFAVILCKSKIFSPQTFCLVLWLSNKTSFELNWIEFMLLTPTFTTLTFITFLFIKFLYLKYSYHLDIKYH